jgi:hypothetical protein
MTTTTHLHCPKNCEKHELMDSLVYGNEIRTDMFVARCSRSAKPRFSAQFTMGLGTLGQHRTLHGAHVVRRVNGFDKYYWGIMCLVILLAIYCEQTANFVTICSMQKLLPDQTKYKTENHFSPYSRSRINFLLIAGNTWTKLQAFGR